MATTFLFLMSCDILLLKKYRYSGMLARLLFMRSDMKKRRSTAALKFIVHTNTTIFLWNHTIIKKRVSVAVFPSFRPLMKNRPIQGLSSAKGDFSTFLLNLTFFAFLVPVFVAYWRLSKSPHQTFTPVFSSYDGHTLALVEKCARI